MRNQSVRQKLSKILREEFEWDDEVVSAATTSPDIYINSSERVRVINRILRAVRKKP